MPDPTITVIEPPTKTTPCGGARSKVKWGATGNGYIIQHIRIEDGRKNCFTDRPLPRKESNFFLGHFWYFYSIASKRALSKLIRYIVEPPPRLRRGADRSWTTS